MKLIDYKSLKSDLLIGFSYASKTKETNKTARWSIKGATY